jgi:hypothetical protein
MAKVTIQSSPFRSPVWPHALLKPATDVTIKVDAPKIKGDQHIEFRIMNGAELVDVVVGTDGQQTATWKVPNLSNRPGLKFDALLKQKPTPQNGFHAVLQKVTSPVAQVCGFSVKMGNTDPAFVPHAEQFHVAYTVVDPNAAATAGRFEIWGERYPTNKPLYTENFIPANGAHNWNTWNGSANAGLLNGKFISPEFSPYRLRIVIGTDQGSVDDAFGAGVGKVAVAEKEFEVKFKSVNIRIQAGITETASGAPANAGYTLAQALAIEPYNPNGSYAHMGRLPTRNPAEIGRIRIPMACHQRSPADSLGQGGLAIGGAYFDAGGQPKRTIDGSFYNRPEIPVEFELRLLSRDPAKNAAPALGVFDKEAVGPAKIEPYIEDVYQPALYDGAGLSQTYWRKSVSKIKDGQHTGPTNSGAAGVPAAGVAANSPLFNYWQYRKAVPADGTINVDLDNFDANDKTYHYQPGKNELTVYLDRTRLVLGKDQAALDKVQADYIEVDNHTIKLRSNFTKANQILWIVRVANGAAAVPDWNVFPPGTNCHRWYGGVRGSDPANGLLHKDYPAAVGTEPIIGKINGAYPYAANNFINLAPHPKVAANRQERVEISAIVAAGNQQGLAGVLFSPSFIAGDSYAINAYVDTAPYERNLGWVEAKPAVQVKTGTLDVWRVITISDSQRLPDPGTNGLQATVGCQVEVTPPNTRTYIGDGVNMNMSGMNTTLSAAFNEWVVAPPDARVPAADVHKNVNLATYRAQYSGTPFAGQVPMPNNNAIRNDFIPIDAYRLQLPAGFPANRQNAASNVIAGLPRGTLSAVAMARVQARLTAKGAAAADDALNVGVAAIPLSPAAWTSIDYFWWVVGIIGAPKTRILNALIPQIAQPKVVKVIRWPFQHENGLWDDGANMAASGMTLQGEYVGNSQSDFITGLLDPNLFQHEMGHSVHLVHFVGGNFGWKHHNILQSNCMMSYNWPVGFVVSRGAPTDVGPTAPATTVDRGWPHRVPNAAALTALRTAGHSYNMDPAVDPNGAGPAAGGTPCIRLDAFPPNVPSNPCAKCILKLRGWQETVLPVAWNHPDLF